MALEERLKQRLLGGAVLVALVVIFVPMLLDEPVERHAVSDYEIPKKSAPEPMTQVKRIEQERAVEQRQAPVIVQPESKEIAESKPKSAKEAPAEVSKPPEEPRSAPARPSPAAWIIQVASLTNEDNARKLVERLRKEDLPAQMEEVRINGKLHYRVRVGPEVDHRLAEKMVAKIKKGFKLNPKLMQYPE
jgi:DedD protein